MLKFFNLLFGWVVVVLILGVVLGVFFLYFVELL